MLEIKQFEGRVIRVLYFRNEQSSSVVKLHVVQKGREFYVYRSVLSKAGITRHYQSQQCWYADYQVLREVEKQSVELDCAGFVLESDEPCKPVTTINMPTLLVNTNDKASKGFPVPCGALLISVVVDYHHTVITSQLGKYNTKLPPALKQHFQDVRNHIDFKPFSMFAFFDAAAGLFTILAVQTPNSGKYHDREYANWLKKLLPQAVQDSKTTPPIMLSIEGSTVTVYAPGGSELVLGATERNDQTSFYGVNNAGAILGINHNFDCARVVNGLWKTVIAGSPDNPSLLVLAPAPWSATLSVVPEHYKVDQSQPVAAAYPTLDFGTF